MSKKNQYLPNGELKGYQMNIYKQDPSVRDIGIRTVFILGEVNDGPSDKLIKILSPNTGNGIKAKDGFRIDLCPIKRFNSIQKIEAFDWIHTFATCRIVLTMYSRAFARLGDMAIGKDDEGKEKKIDIVKEEDKKDGQFDFLNKWGKPLEVEFYKKSDKVYARYADGINKIDFSYKDDIYSCRSFDVIAHEMGHAVLNAMWKGKVKGFLELHAHAETLSKEHLSEKIALSEAFADLTTLFAILAQMDMCEATVVFSKGNLMSDSFLKNIAEEFGIAKGKRFIRDLSVNYHFDMSYNNNHEFSQVFSGAVYHLLSEVFNDRLKLEMYDPAETLFRVARFIAATTLAAYYLSSDDSAVTFASVGNKMIYLLKNMRSSNIIGNNDAREGWADKLEDILRKKGISREIPGNETKDYQPHGSSNNLTIGNKKK